MLIGACSINADGPKISSLNPSSIEPNDDLGQLVLYRPKEFEGGGVLPEISIDGSPITNGGKAAECFNGGVLLINMPAGTYEVSLEARWVHSSEIRVNIESNRKLHVKCYARPGVFVFQGRTVLEIVETGVAEEEIFATESLSLTGIYDLKAESSSLSGLKLEGEQGENINLHDGGAMAPLHVATEERNRENVKLLIMDGADVQSKDDIGRSPLHIAAEKGPPDIVRMLIDAGADVNSRDDVGKTPLYKVGEDGNSKILKMLIDAGADLNSRDQDGETPLHYYARDSITEKIELLVKAGADVDSRTKNGDTPLHVSAQHGSADNILMLIDAGADMNARNENGDTPLHSAGGSYKKVDILLDAGADPKLRNKDGSKPKSKVSIGAYNTIIGILAVAVLAGWHYITSGGLS